MTLNSPVAPPGETKSGQIVLASELVPLPDSPGLPTEEDTLSLKAELTIVDEDKSSRKATPSPEIYLKISTPSTDIGIGFDCRIDSEKRIRATGNIPVKKEMGLVESVKKRIKKYRSDTEDYDSYANISATFNNRHAANTLPTYIDFYGSFFPCHPNDRDSITPFQVARIFLDGTLSHHIEKGLTRVERRYNKKTVGHAMTSNPVTKAGNESHLPNVELDTTYIHDATPHNGLVAMPRDSISELHELYIEAAVETAPDIFARFPDNHPPIISVPPHLEHTQGDPIRFNHLVNNHHCLRESKIIETGVERRLSKHDALTPKPPNIDCPNILDILPASTHPSAGRLVKDIKDEDLRLDPQVLKSGLSIYEYTRYWISPGFLPDPEDYELAAPEDAQCPYLCQSEITLLYGNEMAMIECALTTVRNGLNINIYEKEKYPDQMIEAVKEYLYENSPIPLEQPSPTAENPLENPPLFQ